MLSNEPVKLFTLSWWRCISRSNIFKMFWFIIIDIVSGVAVSYSVDWGWILTKCSAFVFFSMKQQIKG